MSAPMVTTKLYIPALRPNVVVRPRLIARLNAGLPSKLTLIAAPAGFGKTTLLSAWLASNDEDGTMRVGCRRCGRAARTGQSARRHNFVNRMPEVAAMQVRVLLRQGNLAAATQLAQTHDLPLSQVRVHLAQGNASAALAVIEPWHRQVATKGWQDELLQVLVLKAVTPAAYGQTE